MILFLIGDLLNIFKYIHNYIIGHRVSAFHFHVINFPVVERDHENKLTSQFPNLWYVLSTHNLQALWSQSLKLPYVRENQRTLQPASPTSFTHKGIITKLTIPLIILASSLSAISSSTEIRVTQDTGCFPFPHSHS